MTRHEYFVTIEWFSGGGNAIFGVFRAILTKNILLSKTQKALIMSKCCPIFFCNKKIGRLPQNGFGL